MKTLCRQKDKGRLFQDLTDAETDEFVSLSNEATSFAATRTRRTTLLWEDLKPKTHLPFFIIIAICVVFSTYHAMFVAVHKLKSFSLLLPEKEQV